MDAQLALLSKRSNSDPPRARRSRASAVKKRRSSVPIIAALAVLGVATAVGVELGLSKRAWLTRAGEPESMPRVSATSKPLLAIDRAQVAPHEALAEPPASAELPPAVAPSALKAKPVASASERAQRNEAPLAAEPEEELKVAPEAELQPAPPAAFDAQAAEIAIDGAALLAQSCKGAEDPEGVAVVIVTFAPSGRTTTATVSGEPYAGTTIGSCIAAKFRAASVPPFSGEFITVKKSFSLKNTAPAKK